MARRAGPGRGSRAAGMDPWAATHPHTHTHTDLSGGFSITVSTNSDLGNLEFNSGFGFRIQFASFFVWAHLFLSKQP